MRLVCKNQNCGKLFDGNDRAKLPARYCPDCAAERKRETDRASYLKNKSRYTHTERGYILVHDPDEESALVPGMRISIIEHDTMLKLESYTPGTIIRQGNERKRIDLVQGKMVEVRI